MQKKSSESNLNGIGFLLKLKKRSKGKGINSINFFKKFIEKALIDVKSNESKISVNYDNMESILLAEIDKKTGIDKKKKKDAFRNSISEKKKKFNDYFINLPPRNIDTIIFCLRKMKKFNEFIKFNNISYEQLEKLAAYIKPQFIKKNNLLYSMGKRAKKFFCVINGCISLRTVDPIRIQEEKRIKNYEILVEENSENNSDKKNIFEDIKEKNIFNLQKDNNNDNDMNNNIKEFEIRKYTQGMCLCEWDLIRRRMLIDNAYAIEDTNVFYLEKEYFDKILSSHISRSDIERKYFIMAKIPLLSLDNLYNVHPEFYNKGDIIYTEFDRATEAILIYKGLAAITILNNARNKKDIYLRKKELKIITSLERGGLAGLEIGKIPSENEEIFYENTLIIEDDNTIIFRLNIDILKGKSQKLGRNLQQFFKELYTQQNDYINNLKNNSLKRLKMNIKPSLEDKRMDSLNELFESLSNQKKEIKENNLEKIKTQINMNYHFNIENNFSKHNTNKKIYRRNKTNKNLTLYEVSQKSKSIEQSTNVFFSTENNNRKHINYDILNNIKSNKIILKKKINDNINFTPSKINNAISNYNNYFKNSRIKSENEYNFTMRNEENKNNYIPIKINNKNNFFSFNPNKQLKLNNINKSEDIQINCKTKYNINRLNKNIYNIKKYYYDSGQFKIPLLSLDINNYK